MEHIVLFSSLAPELALILVHPYNKMTAVNVRSERIFSDMMLGRIFSLGCTLALIPQYRCISEISNTER